MSELPWFKMHAGDYLGDIKLKRCSFSTTGVYSLLLCIAFQCEERGVFITDGEPWTVNEILNSIGGDMNEKQEAWAQLIKYTRFKVREDGAFYNSRMVRDESERVSNVKRQSGHREKVKGNANSNSENNADVTQEVTQEITAQSSEFRVQNNRVLEDEEERKNSPSILKNENSISIQNPKENAPLGSAASPRPQNGLQVINVDKFLQLYPVDQDAWSAMRMMFKISDEKLLEILPEFATHRKQGSKPTDTYLGFCSHIGNWYKKKIEHSYSAAQSSGGRNDFMKDYK